MLLLDTLVLALKNIWSNKMRTILTMLGIIIGVTAVIVIVGLGNGMTESVRQSFSAMGINSMQVNIWGRNSSRNASVDYMYGVVEDHPQYLRDISPYIQLTGGHTVILITHDNSIAMQAPRIIRLEDGRIVYDGDAHSPEAFVASPLFEAQMEEFQKMRAKEGGAG